MCDLNLLGVAISTYKRPDDLRKCLTCLFHQDYEFDLFIVDNASGDKTLQVLQEFSSMHQNMQYEVLSKPNPSAIQTINYALRKLHNKYVVILDDDTFLYDSTILRKLVSTANTDDNIAIVACNVRDCTGKISFVLKTPFFDATDYPHVSDDEIFDVDDFSGACALFRRSLVGPMFYDESYALYWNESDLAIRMVANGHRVVINQRAIVIHGSNVNRESCRSFYYGSMNTFRLMNKVLGRKQSFVFTCILLPFHIKRYLSMYKEPKFFIYSIKCAISWIRNFYWIFFMDKIHFNDHTVEMRVKNTYIKYYLKELMLSLP